MTSSVRLLDTDTLSMIMRRHPIALAHAQKYVEEHQQFLFSVITRYEVLRGLKAKKAHVQLAAFERFCVVNQILPLTDNVVTCAAEIYAELYQRGALISDADILIAASALTHGMSLVTNNEKHFERINGLHVENWLKP